MIEFLDFVLWCVQEAGVLLSVGAALAVLAGYIVALRDGKLTEKEVRYSKNSHRVIVLGLTLMIASGFAIVALHLALSQDAIVFAPVFLFKWFLITALVSAYVAQRKKPYGSSMLEGVMGGTWLTLFLVHTVAPAVSWTYLIILFALVMTGFLLIWSALVKLTQEKHQPAKLPVLAPISATASAAPKPVLAVVSVPQPTMSAAPPAPTLVPVQPPEPPKAPEAHHSLWLPMLHVMPKTQSQLDEKSHITPLARFLKNK